MTEEKTLYTEIEKIKSFHVDYRQQLKLSALFSFMQEVAYQHAEALGMGFSHLSEANNFWVLSRVLIQVDRYPKWNDELVIETWPKGFKQLFGMRDFKITDTQNRPVASATTAWLVLDKTTRRPVRVNEVMKHLPCNDNQEAISAFPQKLPQVVSEGNKIKRYQVDYSAIDQNGHVNNTKYIDWICDYFSRNEFEDQSFRSIQVNFNHELQWGDQLVLSCQEREGELLFAGQSENTGKNIFQACLKN